MTISDPIEIALIAGIAASCLRLFWVDVKKLEIEFETLFVLACLALAHSILYLDIALTGLKLFSGLAFYSIVVFFKNRVSGFGKIGAGDPPLIGVLAFLVAPHLLIFAVLASVFILATCKYYAWRRGKPGLKSMFPAAPPLLSAALPLYVGMNFSESLKIFPI